MKNIEIKNDDIKLLEQALTGWQTMGISISAGERGSLDDITRAEWMNEELATANPVLNRFNLDAVDMGLALERTEVNGVESEEKLETLQALGVEMMKSDIPIVRRNGADMAINANTEKMRRALSEVTSMESLCESVRQSIRQTAEERTMTEKDVVLNMAPSLLGFRVDETNYQDVELAVVTILASRIAGK
ncbi:MAG: hypothetical protein WC851_04185 [Candidatus Shapirobacteria bacterium]|jgi:hypothetical protein